MQGIACRDTGEVPRQVAAFVVAVSQDVRDLSRHLPLALAVATAGVGVNRLREPALATLPEGGVSHLHLLVHRGHRHILTVQPWRLTLPAGEGEHGSGRAAGRVQHMGRFMGGVAHRLHAVHRGRDLNPPRLKLATQLGDGRTLDPTSRQPAADRLGLGDRVGVDLHRHPFVAPASPTAVAELHGHLAAG